MTLFLSIVGEMNQSKLLIYIFTVINMRKKMHGLNNVNFDGVYSIQFRNNIIKNGMYWCLFEKCQQNN